MARHAPESAAAVRRAGAPLEEGRRALERGAWTEAVRAFRRVVARAPEPNAATAEAWAGIGLASYWIGNGKASTAAFEQAFGQYRDLGMPTAAARSALWLADVQLSIFGASAVGNGWLEHAKRLLADVEPCAEHAWLLAYRGHYALSVEGDAALALDLAREGQALAHEVGAPDPELVTMALEGLARVFLGHVGEGMARLDEASAAAVARGLKDLNAVAWACCYLVLGCGSIRDLPRAAEWCRRVMAFCDEWGLTPVYATCRIEYAAVLTWQGAWDAAESELAEADGGEPDSSSPVLQCARWIRLGDLRRRQGRLDLADHLYRHAGEHPLAVAGCAGVALDRGDPATAMDLADRALRLLPGEAWTDRVDALLVRVGAAAALGDAARVAEDVAELAAIAERGGTAVLRAIAALAKGIAESAAGDLTAACVALEAAVAHGDRGGAPYEAARARLELADVLARLGRLSTARREAVRAKETFEALGAQHDARRAGGLLGALARPADPSRAVLTKRETEVLRLVARGWKNQRIATELFLSPHTVKRHVANILRKLDVPSRAAAVARGTRLGLLE